MGNVDGLGYEGATVVVTGCASGRGAATARILGDLGAEVHAADDLGAIHDLFNCAGMATIASDPGMGWQANLQTIFELLAIDDPYEARRWCEEHPEALRFDGCSFSKEMLIAWVAGTVLYTDQGFAGGVMTGAVDPAMLATT